MAIKGDADQGNADWPKTRTWDALRVRTDADLVEWLKEMHWTMDEFKKMPCYQGWLKFKKSQNRK